MRAGWLWRELFVLGIMWLISQINHMTVLVLIGFGLSLWLWLAGFLIVVDRVVRWRNRSRL